MKSYEGANKRILLIAAALALASQAAFAQGSAQSAPKPHKKTIVHRILRATLSPSDFPINLKAYDRTSKEADSSGTVLEISKNGYKSFKPEALYTKDLDGEQISSVVSWENPERTHFGFLVLTTPSSGNLYSVMFFLYHDGKLSIPIDDIATGYPVFPSIRRTDATGQIQISFDDGSTDDTNDKVRTVVIYTWSDYGRKFLKTVHRVAGEAVQRSRPRRVERTQAADGDGDQP